MKALRAILGRFARFLVRIARTLDPGVAATPYWAMAERMAALRQRYPGAPEHWLEMLARQPVGPPPRPAAEHAQPETRPETSPLSQDRAPAGRGARPAPRFPSLLPRLRPTATAAPSATQDRPDPTLPAAASRSLRPSLAFAAPRVRNPIANLLRPERAGPHPAAHFPGEAGTRADRDGEWPPDRERGRRDERMATFGETDVPRERARAGVVWPEFRFSAAPGSSWPGPPPAAGRDGPQFPTSDGRWPELPPRLDESAALVLRASDEAALLAEQIGGTWSA